VNPSEVQSFAEPKRIVGPGPAAWSAVLRDRAIVGATRWQAAANLAVDSVLRKIGQKMEEE